MTLEFWGSIVITALSMAAFWALGTKRRWPWLANVGTNGVWFVYGILTYQPGLMIGAVVGAAIALHNWQRWRTASPAD